MNKNIISIGMKFQELPFLANRGIFVAFIFFVLFFGGVSCSIYTTHLDYYRQKDTPVYDIVPFQDSLTNLMVYDYVEKMPSYGKSRADFIEGFINQLSNTDVLRNIPIRIQVSFVVSERGNVIGARLIGNKTSFTYEEENAILSAIESLDKWTPGQHNNKNVNVILYFPISIDPR